MTDPISIAGLILAIGGLINSAYKYGKQVKDANKEMTALYGELVALQGILSRIDFQQGEEKKDESDSGMMQLCDSQAFRDALLTSRGILRRLITNLEKMSSNNQALGKLTWPLIKGDVKEDISRLERVKSYFLLVMMADNSSILQEASDSIREVSSAIRADQNLRKEKEDAMKQEALRKWLSPVNPEVSHAKASAVRQLYTGAWFIHGALRDVLDGKNDTGKSTTLWLRGKSGAGKTVLLSAAIDEARKFSECRSACKIAYFYCSFDDRQSQEPASILGSILVQLLNQMPDEMQGVEQSVTLGNPPSMEIIRDLILKIVQKLSRFILLLDAINECYDPEVVLEQFVDLAQRANNIGMVITSTGSPFSTPLFTGIDNFMEVDMGSAPLEDDMITYINTETRERKSLRALSQALQERIKSEVPAKANGMFRYVQCQIDYLSTRRTPREVKEALDRLPDDLFATYAATLARVKQEDREMARDALQWLAHTREPPTLFGLAEAVVVREGDCFIDEDCRISDPEVLLEICQGLISYNGSTSTVALAHPSVRTFLTSDHSKRDEAVFYSVPEHVVEEKMARKCLTYLMLDDFRSGYCEERALRKRSQRYPLLQYAAKYWANHARCALGDEPGKTSLIKPILEFYHTYERPNRGNFGAWIQCLVPGKHQAYESQPLYYAASFGLTPVVEVLLDSKIFEIDAKGGRFQSTALQVAVFRKQIDVVKVLLKAGADPNLKNSLGETSLFWARTKGEKAIADLLKQYGAVDGAKSSE